MPRSAPPWSTASSSSLRGLLSPRLNPGLIAGVFSFVLTIAFVPWWSGPSNSPRWALIALASLAAFWCAVRPKTEHWLGAAWLAWAALSLLWSMGPYEGAEQLARLWFLAGIFVIGAALPDLRPVIVGLGLGFCVNSALAVAQMFGFAGIPSLGGIAGLFARNNYLGEPAALVLVALVPLALAEPRLWWLAAGVAPSVVLSGSRGAWLAIAVAATAWIWTRSKLAAIILVMAVGLTGFLAFERGLAGPAITRQFWSSTEERLLIWRSTAEGLTFTGSGLGSFRARFPSHAPDFNFIETRPGHAHNDFLEMVYELGPGALLYVAMLLLLLCGPLGAEKLVLIAFMAEGSFGFPLHFPVTAAFAALAAGRLSRLRQPLRCGAHLRRAAIRLGLSIRANAGRGHLDFAAREAGVPVRPAV